jgi:hypothetical protein
MPARLVIIFILTAYNASGQSYFQSGLMAGRIIENHPGFPEVKNLSLGTEFRAGKKLTGSKSWHRCYHFAEAGLALTYASVGNAEVLGNYVSAIPELTIPWKHSQKWQSSFSLGLGAAWFNKPFHRISNRSNIVIGSAFTFCANAAVNIEYAIHKNFSLCVRPQIYHASNAHSNLPNVGMNLPALTAAIKYRLKTASESIPDTSTHYDDQIKFSVRMGLGYNQFGPTTGPGGPHYPIYLLSMMLTKKISLVNKLQTGFEGWYNTGVYEFILSQEFYEEKQKQKSLSLIWFAGHEWLMGHVSLVTQGGIYLYHPFYRDRLKRFESYTLKEKLKTIFPARIGLQYYLHDETSRVSNNFFIGIYIKTNLGQADFLDSGIGYRF